MSNNLQDVVSDRHGAHRLRSSQFSLLKFNFMITLHVLVISAYKLFHETSWARFVSIRYFLMLSPIGRTGDNRYRSIGFSVQLL